MEQVAKQREKRKKGDGKTARASTTDPESRRMKMGDGGTRPAYNVEFSTDLNSLVIVGADVVNAGSDAGQMEPMVQHVEADQAPLPEGGEYYVDGGFTSNQDLASVSARGVTVFAPVKAVKKAQAANETIARPAGIQPSTAWVTRTRR